MVKKLNLCNYFADISHSSIKTKKTMRASKLKNLFYWIELEINKNQVVTIITKTKVI